MIVITLSDRRRSRVDPPKRPPLKEGSRGRADRSAYVTIGLLVISLLLMTFDVRSSGQGYGATLRSATQYLTSPIQGGLNAVVAPVIDVTDGIASLAGLRAENERLRARIAELELEVIRVRHLEERVDELDVLLGLRLEEDLYELAVNAEVTGRAGTLDAALIIDRGTEDGVHPGQPAVDSRGALLGLVSTAGEQTATIIPITSRQAAGVTVRLSDDRRGIVEGHGTGRLQLLVLDTEDPVQEGELLITFGPFGQADSYPKGLEVGTVTRTAVPQAGSVRVEVDPVGDLEAVEFVAVIPWEFTPEQAADGVTDTTAPEDTVPANGSGDPSSGVGT